MKNIVLITALLLAGNITFGQTFIEIQHFRSTEEHFSAVPVTLGNSTEWRTIYFLAFYDLKPGDILQIISEGQVRNNLGYNVELGQTITINQDVYGGKDNFENHSEITRFVAPINGSNITPGAHYGKWTKVGTYVIRENDPAVYWQTDEDGHLIGKAFVCMRIRARSSGATAEAKLDVNQGQGFISAIKFVSN